MAALANTLFTIAMVPAAVGTATAWSGPPLTAIRGESRTDAAIRSERSSTEIKVAQPDTPLVDPIEVLKQTARTYATFVDGWDGEGSFAASAASVESSLAFIDQLPGGLPLPGIMLARDGELGFYWDLIGGYADISFSLGGSASFFSRSNAGEEQYIDEIPLHRITRSWFFEQLGQLASPTARAA